jgi:hypothetical protein
MEDMKHFAEAVGRLTPGRLDKATKRVTVKSVRNKIRKFMSQWQLETNLTIPKEVHDSMASQKVRRSFNCSIVMIRFSVVYNACKSSPGEGECHSPLASPRLLYSMQDSCTRKRTSL